MTALTLTRNDPAKNLRRYYRLDVQPDLFGAWCLIREWGRIGRSGQTREVPYPTPPKHLLRLSANRASSSATGIGSARKSWLPLPFYIFNEILISVNKYFIK